jgi:hypothetical protein
MKRAGPMRRGFEPGSWCGRRDSLLLEGDLFRRMETARLDALFVGGTGTATFFPPSIEVETCEYFR